MRILKKKTKQTYQPRAIPLKFEKKILKKHETTTTLTGWRAAAAAATAAALMPALGYILTCLSSCLQYKIKNFTKLNLTAQSTLAHQQTKIHHQIFTE